MAYKRQQRSTTQFTSIYMNDNKKDWSMLKPEKYVFFFIF
jgi:hypothetical protein